jgi:hypothetical protein
MAFDQNDRNRFAKLLSLAAAPSSLPIVVMGPSLRDVILNVDEGDVRDPTTVGSLWAADKSIR